MQEKQILYFHEGVRVSIGDFVEAKIWLRWKKGRVVYVPGVSEFNSNMEYNGLQWVGIQIDDGPFLGVVVDPKTSVLKKTVRLLDRGKIDELSPNVDPFAENN